MRSRRRLQWDVPQPPRPQHPYRDTVILYTALAIVIVVLAALTGGPVGKAIVIAVAFLVAAVSWSTVQWRRRLKREAAERGELDEL